jgi:hypothetical protein
MAYQQSANTIFLSQQINTPPDTNQLAVFFFHNKSAPTNQTKRITNKSNLIPPKFYYHRQQSHGHENAMFQQQTRSGTTHEQDNPISLVKNIEKQPTNLETP